MTQPCAIVIEDDPKLSAIYVTALEHAGFEVVLDMNGDRVKSLLLFSPQPALVILDLHLPFASGMDLLPLIREKCPTTVIAVVTADIVKAKSLPGKADHVLIKPVSLASLLQIAESAKVSAVGDQTLD
ncbi:MAG: response regulator transcription factor [Chloroflexi bacterium]|nr:response regulator transcription factor [Chloroflexota bacterium]